MPTTSACGSFGQKVRQPRKEGIVCSLSKPKTILLGPSQLIWTETLPLSSILALGNPGALTAYRCANHRQREHAKVGGFTFPGFVFPVCFFVGLSDSSLPSGSTWPLTMGLFMVTWLSLVELAERYWLHRENAKSESVCPDTKPSKQPRYPTENSKSRLN